MQTIAEIPSKLVGIRALEAEERSFEVHRLRSDSLNGKLVLGSSFSEVFTKKTELGVGISGDKIGIGGGGTELLAGAVQSGHSKGAKAPQIGDLTGNRNTLWLQY
jgi:hypothetical protein